jgi:hypothetical protein
MEAAFSGQNSEQTAFSSQRSAISQNQQQRQNHFTAKDAKDIKDTERNEGLPLSSGEQRPLQGMIAPDDRQVHAVLG